MINPRMVHERQRGVSLIELVIVVALVFIIGAFAVPTYLSTVRNSRTNGDSRDVAGEILLAKMRGSANFTQSRVYFDAAAQTFRIETWDKTNSCWKAEGAPDCATKPAQPLSQGVSLGFGSLSTPPPGTQATIAEPPACLDDTTTPGSGSAIANTSCIPFNSRGIPINPATGSPAGNYAVYITDGSSVYAATVSATGLVQNWRSEASAANWQKR
jgi:type II secretory pathway pseudopilin PulG